MLKDLFQAPGWCNCTQCNHMWAYPFHATNSREGIQYMCIQQLTWYIVNRWQSQIHRVMQKLQSAIGPTAGRMKSYSGVKQNVVGACNRAVPCSQADLTHSLILSHTPPHIPPHIPPPHTPPPTSGWAQRDMFETGEEKFWTWTILRQQRKVQPQPIDHCSMYLDPWTSDLHLGLQQTCKIRQTNCWTLSLLRPPRQVLLNFLTLLWYASSTGWICAKLK